MTGLYSVNLHVMGSSNIPLIDVKTLATYAEHVGIRIFGGPANLNVAGWAVSVRDASMLICILSSSSPSASCSISSSALTWAPPCAPPGTIPR